MDNRKTWECAHAWAQDAAWQVFLCYVNRLHRSGPWGECAVRQAEEWEAKCDRDLERVTKELGYDPYK